MDDCIVAFFKGQEMDHFLHEVNKERYSKILEDVELADEEFRSAVKLLLEGEEKELAKVEKIMQHTRGQLPTNAQVYESLKRLKDKEDAFLAAQFTKNA